MTSSEKLKFIIQLPLERKLWLICCFIGSIVCWFAIRILSPKKLAASLGHQYLSNRQVSVLATDVQATKASRIGKLMESVSKNVPWECKCLSEAICVKWLLNRYQIPSVFYLGARLQSPDILNSDNQNKNEQKIKEELQAHAWVTVGPYTVIGAPNHRSYQVVATFVTPVLRHHA